VSPDARVGTINSFHRLYYRNAKAHDWKLASWMGYPVAKFPGDLLVYQDIVYETKPDVIIETGSWYGGSGLYLAHLCDLLRNGRVISIDVAPYARPQHPRLLFVTGSSTDWRTRQWVDGHIRGKRVMVILDSDHSKRHVLEELDVYGPLVTPGCYLVVEDTNVNGRPVEEAHGPGPAEALDEWLPKHPEFEIDADREKFLVSFNPGGYLRRREE
jgi:cephalosporin hydroxylase